MSTFIVFQQMLVLFAMIFIGYFVYKKKWVGDISAASINKLVVNIFNPVLIISSILGKEKPEDLSIMWQNLALVIIYFAGLIILSMVVSAALKFDKKEAPKYQMMLVFSNTGFMGIPVIKGVLGDHCVIYVTIYVVVFNLLIYTYGIYLAKKSNENAVEKIGLTKTLKSIFLNVGVIAAVIALVIYVTGIKVPAAVENFAGYVGNATVPLSMMAIGFSLARMPIKEIFGGTKAYIFTVIKMLIIPIAGVMALRLVPIAIDENVKHVFIFMLSMPIGSIVSMISQEYGNDKGTCGKVTVITTVVSLVTIPIVAIFM